MATQIFVRFRQQNFTFLKIFASFLLIILCWGTANGQTNDDLSNIRVEELTDDQIRHFIQDIKRMNIPEDQMEANAIQRGMSPVEIIKLRNRMASVRASMESTVSRPAAGTGDPFQDSIRNAERGSASSMSSAFTALRSKNFGAEVFNNPRLSFEPNLRLPTPKNYILAPDDELVIDISGNSEANYRLKVSSEGVIRIPQVGPVSVSGLTIEQAKKNIIGRLSSSIYSNIKSGKTFVDVNLGAVRSIHVMIIGEATVPGTYTLASVATAYNALYACSGPNTNGSFRNIQVIRNNKTIATIDVYQYLVSGSTDNDVPLMDRDVIKINTYAVRVELKGEVKRPGLYDVLDGEKLNRILDYAGGFTENAYINRIQVFRNTDIDRQIETIQQESFASTTPHAGDTYIVGKILNRFTNRISIRGPVFRPGEYQLKSGETLMKLIQEADGLREDVFLGRGVIHRLKSDLSPEIIAFDLREIQTGTMADIELKREDRIVIYSKFDLKEGYFVTIDGEISAPGSFIYEEGMTIQDLILIGGGFKEAATSKRIEVSRRIKTGDTTDTHYPKMALIFQKDVSMDLKDSSGASSFILEPFDQVVVYRSPGYYAQKDVVIEGEVKFPGKYTLESKTDRISDLVRRAGGLTKDAYLNGAVLVRTRMYTQTEINNAQQGLTNLLKQNYTSGVASPFLQLTYDEYLRKRTDNVGINLNIILESPQSEYDLLLNDRDTLRIPRELQTVRVSGEVLYPALVRYNQELSFKDYISGAGGYNVRSDKRKPYVVNANGSASGTKAFLFFKSYPKVYPGSEIFVPMRRERQRISALEAITIGTTLVTLLAILLNVTK